MFTIIVAMVTVFGPMILVIGVVVGIKAICGVFK